MGDKAGILIRVSTTRQGERGASVETQRQDCLAYAERQGWQVVMVQEDHQSGTNFDRAGFRKLADAAQQGVIDKLVIYSIDRFGRNLIDGLIELRGFEDAGVEIHSVTDGGQVRNDLIRDIRLAIAQDYSRQLSGKVMRAMSYRAETGHWVASPPFGYDLIDCPDCGRGKKLTPNAQAPIVTEAAQRFDAGQTYANIRDWLRQEHGLIVGLEWVKGRLTNPAYTGDVIYNRRQRGKFKRAVEEMVVTRDAHPALIDRQTFERIQARFKAPGAIATPTAMPLDGLVFCGVCGARMYRVTGGQKGHYRFYYACSKQRRFKTCVPNQLPYGRVEAALHSEITETFPFETVKAEQQTLSQRFLALVKPDIERLLNGADEVRGRLNKEIEKLGHQQDLAYQDRLDGHVSPEFAAKKLADIQERIDAATKELKTVKSTGTAADWYRACIGQYVEADDHAERELLRLLVARIVVHGDALTVEWTDYAQSIVNVTDGSPSRRPGVDSLRVRSI